jgi:hypothetical protein
MEWKRLVQFALLGRGDLERFLYGGLSNFFSDPSSKTRFSLSDQQTITREHRRGNLLFFPSSNIRRYKRRLLELLRD